MTRDSRSVRKSMLPKIDNSIPPLDMEHADGNNVNLPGNRHDVTRLLQEMVVAQDRQNELLEELVSTIAATHRQRASELASWKRANPGLSRDCRRAADVLGRVQADLLSNLSRDAVENADCLSDGDYYVGEFIDRFGPRLAHLNAMLQVLSHLGGNIPADESIAEED